MAMRWLLLLAVASCGSVKLTVHQPPQPLEVVGVFIYPVGFRWEEPAYRSFELSQRMVGAAVEAGGEKLSFWGPGEFEVKRAEEDAAWVATNALGLLTGTGARPDQGLVIRPWAEKRVNTSLHEAQDAKGRRAGAANAEDTVYIGHVEVVHPATHEVLIETQDEVHVDPFADPGPDAEFDPAPALTALMERLTKAVVKKIVTDWAIARTAQDLPAVPFAFTPSAALRWSDKGRGTAELDMAKMDPAMLDLFLQQRARFLNPRLTDAVAAKISKLNPGLYVAGRAPVPGLDEGDLVTTIDQAPAQPQVWARLRFSPQVTARVRKPSGEVVEVLLP